ncbi:MAG: DUF2474 family protein [Rhizobiaceae bacterium]|jgi:hypothetical protein
MVADAPGSLAKRLVWFIGLWLASVLAVALVAYGLRLWLV